MIDQDVDGRTTRWDAHKARRRRALLDAAVAAIEADGPRVGVQVIARRASVPRSVVYRHFADRSDLDEEISRHIVETLMAELAPALLPRGTAKEAIRRAIRTYLGWIEDHPRLYAFLGARAAPGGSRVIADTRAKVIGLAGEILAAGARKAGQDERFAGTVATGMVGFVDATVNHWQAGERRAATAGELAELITQSIWSMLDGNARAVGVVLDPDLPVHELL
ncbi:TetR family transcriptional regulator [Herbihabitans rhizosphaerae]|uniref:TetR family transcriptional regulator n=1 Tax=Herbihabitans rhizosphaerae TaxID=1872711 RepID=A0A4Q7KJM8_9PSEU|nr:TetR/AcrR family transcriptional regulator [Herbihabitans rhizosphaerae]RZS36396.1 TetR family transcriptional regulator [Herbihabitans rhizosphaerae]